MKFLSFRHVLIGLCMFAGAGLALALKPTDMVAQNSAKVNLEALIPKSFGDWRIDETIVPLIANPEQEALLNKIYSQTLTRTYVNSNNERIMLSIAYGGNQSDNMAVHKPEVCYPAQGFYIVKNPTIADFAIDEANRIPVKRLVAQQGQRVEPITYWTTVGGRVEVHGLKWKIQQLKFGLTGKIPDGLLFRVSSIQADDAKAYQAQDEFTRALLKAMDPKGRARIVGNQGT